MLLSKEQMAEAFELRQNSVPVDSIATLMGVGEDTMRRYLRNAETYGFSLWADDHGETKDEQIERLTRDNLKLLSRLTTIETHMNSMMAALAELDVVFKEHGPMSADELRLARSELATAPPQADNREL